MIKNYINHHKLQIGLFSLLSTFIIIFMILSPQTFLSFRIYKSLMSIIPFTTMLALSLTFLIIAGEMDLSFPSVMAMSGFVFSTVFTATGNSWLAFVCSLLTGALCGLLNGIIIVKIGVPAIIATIGTQFFWRGLTNLLANGLSKNIVEVRDSTLYQLTVTRLFGQIPGQAIWCLGFAILLWFLLNRHTWGDNIHFIGDNLKTAKLMGVNTDLDRILLFVLMGITSALVSVMICLEMANWWPTQGEGYLLLVFASVFIGGTSAFGGKGTIFGTLIGSIIIGLIESGIISVGLSGYWTRLFYGLIIIGSVSIYAIMFKTKEFN